MQTSKSDRQQHTRASGTATPRKCCTSSRPTCSCARSMRAFRRALASTRHHPFHAACKELLVDMRSLLRLSRVEECEPPATIAHHMSQHVNDAGNLHASRWIPHRIMNVMRRRAANGMPEACPCKVELGVQRSVPQLTSSAFKVACAPTT